MLKKILYTALLFMLSTDLIFAAHPLSTEDTATQGKGKYLLELNSEWTTETTLHEGITQSQTEYTLLSSLSFGIGNNTDLIVGIPVQSSHVKENGITTTNEQGAGDLSAEVKWRFFDNRDSGTSFALKPGITLPSGNDIKGLGHGMITAGAMIIATHEGSLGSLNANISYTRSAYRLEQYDSNTRHDLWRASAAATLSLSDTLTGVANIGIDANDNKNLEDHPLFFAGELIWNVSKGIDLNIGTRTSLNGTVKESAMLTSIAASF